ncbi:MAG TPA: hypothetical protein VF498_12645 [Anaerolineales bacterium]
MDELERAQDLVSLGYLLISRLERLSADSVWAHRASGLRGALIRTLEQVESTSGPNQALTAPPPVVIERLRSQIDMGFEMLNNAAKELI